MNAARAMSIDPYAVIKMIERCGSRERMSRSSSRPLLPGRLTSSRIKIEGIFGKFPQPDFASFRERNLEILRR